MLMTEKVAATKRCTPSLVALVAYATNVEHALGATVAAPFPVMTHECIGSKCAQWSWYDYANQDGKTYFESDDPFAKGRLQPKNGSGIAASPARGYCGLTGSK